MAKSAETAVTGLRAYESHAQELIGQTLSQDHLPWIIYRDVMCGTLQRRDHSGAAGIPVETMYGRLYLFVWVQLRVRAPTAGYRLKVEQYRYRLQEGPKLTTRALFRWDFEPETAGSHPHHHLQLASRMTTSRECTLDLDRLHMPTGYVPLEGIIAFLVHELGVVPACGTDQIRDLLGTSLARLYELLEDGQRPES